MIKLRECRLPSKKVHVMVYLAIALGLTAMPLAKVHGRPQLTAALDRARQCLVGARGET